MIRIIFATTCAQDHKSWYNSLTYTSTVNYRKRELIMAKKQEAAVTETTIKNTLNLQSILADVGITVTDEQLDMLSQRVTVKKSGRGKAKYSLGTVQLTPEDKIAPQARIAIENLKDGMTINEWADAVQKDTRFVTKQDVSKILMYYQKDLIDRNLISKQA